MSLLLDRSKRAGPHLEWKIRLFAAGAVLGVSGMYLEERWVTGAGIAVLLAGALLRLVPGARAPEQDEGDEGDDGAGGGGDGMK